MENKEHAFDATLTPTERAALTFLDWSDATLGRACRQTAKEIKDFQGNRALAIQGAILIMAAAMYEANAETLNIKSDGDTHGQGWTLTLKAKLVKNKKGKP